MDASEQHSQCHRRACFGPSSRRLCPVCVTRCSCAALPPPLPELLSVSLGRHSSLSPLSWPVRGVNINPPAAKSSSLWSETSARGRRWNPASTLYFTPPSRVSSRSIDAHTARRSILAAPQLAFTSDPPRSSKEGQRKSHSTPLLSSTRAYPPPTRIRPMCAIR